MYLTPASAGLSLCHPTLPACRVQAPASRGPQGQGESLLCTRGLFLSAAPTHTLLALSPPLHRSATLIGPLACGLGSRPPVCVPLFPLLLPLDSCALSLLPQAPSSGKGVFPLQVLEI